MCLLLAFVCAQWVFGIAFALVSRGLLGQMLAGAASTAVLLPGVFGMVMVHSGSPNDVGTQLGFCPPRPGSLRVALWTVGKGVLGAIGVFFAMVVVLRCAGKNLGDIPVQPLMREVSGEPRSVGLVAFGLFAMMGAPLSEELLFRSVLYQPMRAHIGVVPAAVIVSVIFAALHFYVWGVPHLIVLSLTFTALFECTGSLWYPIAAHGLYNGLTLVIARVAM